jgi:hypothetical protein
MLLRTIAFASLGLLLATPGNAATWFVAANGTGSTCSAANPCGAIATALSAAGTGDTIVCISPPAEVLVAFSITKSITIDCSSAHAAIRDIATTTGGDPVGIDINIPVSANDTFRTVRLRGLVIDGFTGNSRNFDRGIDIRAAAVVFIEDCIISNVNQLGIYDRRTGGQTKLFIKDSIVSNNGGVGIVAVTAATGVVVLDNVTSENNTFGFAAATGNNVAIRNSVFSGNSAVGIEGDGGAQIIVSNSTISHNNIGVQSTSSIRVSNNDIEFNNTAFSGSAGTMGLNRYSGNVSMGTAPSAVNGAPTDVGP